MTQKEYQLRLDGLIQGYRRCTLPEVRYALGRTIWEFQHTPPAWASITPRPSFVDTEDILQAVRKLEADRLAAMPFYTRWQTRFRAFREAYRAHI